MFTAVPIWLLDYLGWVCIGPSQHTRATPTTRPQAPHIAHGPTQTGNKPYMDMYMLRKGVLLCDTYIPHRRLPLLIIVSTDRTLRPPDAGSTSRYIPGGMSGVVFRLGVWFCLAPGPRHTLFTLRAGLRAHIQFMVQLFTREVLLFTDWTMAPTGPIFFRCHREEVPPSFLDSLTRPSPRVGRMRNG